MKWATCNVGANTSEEYGNYNIFEEAQELSNSKWRVPAIEEIKELLENCDYKWTAQKGVNGGLFTSKKNGNSIFLPAAGGRMVLTCTTWVVVGNIGLCLLRATTKPTFSTSAMEKSLRVSVTAVSVGVFVLLKM